MNADSVSEHFTYRQKTLAHNDITGAIDALHEDGYALIRSVINAEEVVTARKAIDRLQPFGLDGSSWSELNDHFKCVFNRDRLWLSYIDRPGIVDLAEALMGDQCHIIGMTAWKSFPGYDGWRIHTDQLFVPVPETVFADPNFKLPVWICTAHFYLSDMTEDLCPTYVIRGSHKSGRQPNQGEETWGDRAPEPVLCKAGDVLFFRSEIWHSGGKNTTKDRTRYLLQVHYSHRNIAQKFSPWPWQFNPEIIAVATDRQLRLLGKHPESNYG
ncbi:MAG TPA: phytanoyl-CoA dioxygenase family protein [Kamptonema sp.]|nr:phytanoyl-CoA dioxygenase family protein [Kamptonema sp.]